VDVIEHPPIFRLPGIPDHVTYTWLAMIILAGLAFVASRNVALVPRGVQNFMEVGGTCRSSPRSGCSSWSPTCWGSCPA
jgi:hypothetical protein